MKYALIIAGVVKQVQPNNEQGFIEVEDSVVCGMLYDGITFSLPTKTALQLQEEAIAHYKSIYLALVNEKLKELDYDSLATVKLWENDATFGTEATRILTWYKGLIKRNYELLAVGTPMTDEEYLVALSVVVF